MFESVSVNTQNPLSTKVRIETSTSIVLDSLRIIAALVVFVGHTANHWFPEISHSYSPLAHGAVIVFFVLSGYVISFTTTYKKRSWKEYTIARLSRLTSVVYPALLLSIFVQLFLKEWDPELLKLHQRGYDFIRYTLAALFSNEVWLISAAPPINGPLWSLSFEFWYYAIFGAWMYKTKGWKGWGIFIVICFIAGPKILLMMPIWLLGAFAYKMPRIDIGHWNWILFGALLLSSVFVMLYTPSLPYKLGAKPFYFANQFITDYALGLLVALALWLVPNQDIPSIKKKFIKRFRFVADLTFPLYVLHFPLVVLFISLINFKIGSVIQFSSCLIIVLIISLIIGVFLEKKRFVWQNLFKRVFRP